ncbi:hypothetical protein H0H81_005307 [Sphagnurus paluster]|uniref:Uncharacterized protein n=1 Tax=Sphagnurus paluster TaxID=117069 RepID=A0A9P7FW61_9AGAR|nr:hypothetical protein H0H81_005307 [Sphagnurus paluster]
MGNLVREKKTSFSAYYYLTATYLKSPRLVFEVTPEDRTSQFFLAYFSQGGKRLTLIKPPTIVDDTLGNQLKAQLPRKIAEESVGDGLRVIEIKKAPGGSTTLSSNG